MSAQDDHTLCSARKMPDSNGVVRSRGRDQRSVGAIRQVAGAASVPTKRAQTLTCHGVPQFDLTRFVCCCQGSSVWAYLDVVYLSSPYLQNEPRASGFQRPMYSFFEFWQ